MAQTHIFRNKKSPTFKMLALLLSVTVLFLTVCGNPISPTFDLEKRHDGDIMCYDRCYGIDRSRAAEAIDWFCSYFAATHLFYNAAEGQLAVSGN